MKQRKSQWIVVVLIILLTGTLCACGKKPSVDIMGGEENQEKKEESLRDRLGVPEQVEYQLLAGTITADVIMPDCTTVGIYEVEAVELTTDFMDECCKKIFDDGVYDILWPSYIYIRAELQERCDMLAEEVASWKKDDYQSNFVFYDWLDSENRLDVYKKEWEQNVVSDPGNKLVLYPSPIRDTSEIEGLQDDIHYTYLFHYPDYVRAEGTVNGNPARISFMQIIGENCTIYEVKLDLDHDIRADCKEYTKEYAKLLYIDESFAYTEETVIGMAEDYLELFGFVDYEWINTSYLAQYDSYNADQIEPLTAYRVTFGLCKHDVAMLYDSSYEGIISFDIGTEGMIGLDMLMPYRVVSNLTENSELLTFDQISAVAEEYMSEASAYYTDIDRIEFGYIIENYDDGAALIPVWRYMHSSINYQYRIPAFTINAVDGSIVQPIQIDSLDPILWY